MIRRIAALALVAGLGSGCDHAPRAPQRAIGDRGSRAIATALRSPRAGGLADLFPHRRGRVRCVIPGGGPPPGIRVAGLCTTAVRARGSGTSEVRFVESWSATVFSGAGARRRGRLSHTWDFVVSTAPPAHTIRSRSYGDFPPQLVR
jgi:hypothetical protein